jgi:hypothetical protein
MGRALAAVSSRRSVRQDNDSAGESVGLITLWLVGRKHGLISLYASYYISYGRDNSAPLVNLFFR